MAAFGGQRAGHRKAAVAGIAALTPAQLVRDGLGKHLSNRPRQPT
jgi:hypothetical protein